MTKYSKIELGYEYVELSTMYSEICKVHYKKAILYAVKTKTDIVAPPHSGSLRRNNFDLSKK